MTAHQSIPAYPPVEHGGRLAAARRLYPNAPQPWIDLSTGVNPRAYPFLPLAGHVFTRLPDDDAFAALEAAARRAYRAPVAVEIVAGAGAQSFIQIFPRLFPARRVAVLGFAYAEHEACWMASGACVETVETIEETTAHDVGVIVNPNNPDGRLIDAARIATAAADMARRGGLLIVDESFMDFMPESSAATFAAEQGLIVLRSFGKAYGLPGLRLGFALCSRARAARLRAALGPWAVSGPALAIGGGALADESWLKSAAKACAQDAARLDALLARTGFNLLGGTTLYRLAAHAQAPRLHAHLAAQGVLARAFAARPAWLRFGLPGDEEAWARLAFALESFNGD